MSQPKFIITADGFLRLGMVNMHKDLLLPGDVCIGGGYYQFDYVLVPVIKRMVAEIKPIRDRYFRHFKGNEYRLCNIAKDSESELRMVVYQALYGNHDLWVRPEKMFFERMVCDGKEFPRFAEISEPTKINELQ